MNTLDGLRDLVQCGSGTDTALVDGRDIVRGCEETPTLDTTIRSGPSGAVAYGSPVTFKFSSSKPGSTFECHMKGWARWEGCASPKKYPHLGEGHRAFQVRAADRMGNVDPTPDLQRFTIGSPPPDTTLPETSIDSFQINPSNSITFAFSSDPPDAQVLCRIDSWSATRDCSARTNPRTTSALPAGDRTLTVWAVSNGVADPTPAVKSFTIGDNPPPPPPDSPPFLSEFVFPRNVGTPGTPLPESAGSGTGDFDGMDYGSLRDANNVNERMSWVSDPGGSGKTVTEIRLEAGDHADGSDAPSDHRAELYSRNRDLGNHRVGWQVLGFRVPSSNPSGQYGIFQNHAVADARQKTPPQNLNVNGNNLALGIRKIGENRVMHTIGSAAPNVWHYVVLHVGFDSGDNGFVEAWAADNQLPDVSQAPAFADYGYSTLNGGSESSRSHIGFYEGDVSWAGKIWYCGYHRAATFTEASQLPNCPIPTGG